MNCFNNQGKKMKASDFIVGENYRYSQLDVEDTEDYCICEYGGKYIGTSALHIRFFHNAVDVWFIWDHQANEAIFKCVYNS